MRYAVIASFCLSAFLAQSQVGPFPSTSVSLDAINQQFVTVPAGINPTTVNITADPPSTNIVLTESFLDEEPN